MTIKRNPDGTVHIEHEPHGISHTLQPGESIWSDGTPRAPEWVPLERENVTSLDARIAANRNPQHRYPSSTRVHGRWQDGNVRPIRVTVTDDGHVSEHLVRVRHDDRRRLILLVLAVLIVVAVAALLLIRTPGIDAGQPSRSQVRCNLAHQIGEPCRP